MKVANAAFCFMYRTVLHPSETVFEAIVVGLPRCNKLIRAREILHAFEILGNTSKSSIEHAFLNPVCIGSISRGHKEIAHGPAIV